MTVRALRQAGAEVQVVLTTSASQFVTATSLQAVSGNPVRSDLWDPTAEASMGHIELARWADAVLIAPATANTMALLATGQAPDLLTTLYLATNAPVFIAPAMNQAMWLHPAVQRNHHQLRQDGVKFFGPGAGEQACGDIGPGRMLEPDELTQALQAALQAASNLASDPERTNTEFETTPSLAGKRVMITAGPTQEAIDPVRYISNHSSGKQGYALAAAANAAGAAVTLVSGPVALDCPAGVERIDVTTALEMHHAVQQQVAQADIFIGVAAVADYRPADVAAQKIKKIDGKPNSEHKGEQKKSSTDGNSELQLNLVENPDIIAAVAKSPTRPFVVGFAAETHNTLAFARDKRVRKQLDMILVNDVSDQSIGFGSDSNAVTVIWADGELALPSQPKDVLATELIAQIAERYAAELATTNLQPAVN
jgi:phosphopantothenoylcysteine decarboxylase/phosphopantothenate--cysteine ligase